MTGAVEKTDGIAPGSRARRVVVFVHGIQGSPSLFTFLEDTHPPGVDSVNVLLPGHGGSVSEFRRCGRDEWYACVRDALNAARSGHDRLVYVGHSMGCLLGLLAAQRMENAIDRMILLCCPFRIRPTRRYFRNSALAAITRGNTGDPFVKAAWEANGVASPSPIGYLTCPRPYTELFRLIGEAGRLRPRRQARVRFYYSELDEIVSPSSVKAAGRFSSGEIVILPGCGHNYFTEAAKQTLKEALVQALE